MVTISLSGDANLMLSPRLLSMLRPGSRIVWHNFDMGDWTPVRILAFRGHAGGEHTLLLWGLPERHPGR